MTSTGHAFGVSYLPGGNVNLGDARGVVGRWSRQMRTNINCEVHELTKCPNVTDLGAKAARSIALQENWRAKG